MSFCLQIHLGLLEGQVREKMGKEEFEDIKNVTFWKQFKKKKGMSSLEMFQHWQGM